MGIAIRRATINDAGQVAQIINAVISEGRYTLFDRAFSEEEETAFISSLSDRSALYVPESDGEIVVVQSIGLFTNYADSVRHVATMGAWLRRDFRGRGIGRLLAEDGTGIVSIAASTRASLSRSDLREAKTTGKL